MGVHDSELSIVMEDTNFIDSTMDGQPYRAGHHAATLRRLLWREHLGLLPAQKLDAAEDPNAQPPDVCPNDVIDGVPEYEFVADPLGEAVWEMWTGNATKNTEMFRHLFRADPDDNSTCFTMFSPLNISSLIPFPFHHLPHPSSSLPSFPFPITLSSSPPSLLLLPATYPYQSFPTNKTPL